MAEAPAKREQEQRIQEEVKRRMDTLFAGEYEDLYGNPKWRNYR